MSIPLILASGSAGRLATLRAAGIEPRVAVSDVDEDAVLVAASRTENRELSVPEQVAILADAKARAVAATVPPPSCPTLLLGGDSLLECDGVAQGKPGSPERARELWRRIRGGEGTLHTGHVLIDLHSGRATNGVSSTTVRFAELEDGEIDAYVATGEPLHVAGGFTIDGYGGAFVEGVDGDPHGVVGLSLPLLRTLVANLGLRYCDLWNTPT